MNTRHPSWETAPLEVLASEMCLGKMLDKLKNRGEPRPYLRNINVRWFSFDLNDLKTMRVEERELDKFGLRPGDLVICEGGEPGRAAVWSGQLADVTIQKALHRVRFDKRNYSPAFAAYFIYYGTINGHFSRSYTGTTIKHLTGVALAQVEFPLPPQAEQVRIVDRLDELFTDLAAGVAALERVRKKLKRYRSAVLHAAVTGRLTEAWRKEHGPPAESGEQLLKRLLVERRRQWEERTLVDYEAKGATPPKYWRQRYQEPVAPNTENLPALPEGWCWASVDHVAEVQGGLQKSPARAPVKNHFPYLRVANVLRGRLDLRELHRFELTESELDKLRLQDGDLLVVEGNGSASEIGRSAIWEGMVADCVHQNHIIRCRFVEAAIPKFVDAFVNSPLGQSYMRTVASSTSGLHTLSVGKVRSLVLPLPSTAEQELVLDVLQEKLSQIDAMEAEVERGLARATRLRQAILKSAFAGKLIEHDPNDEPASVLLDRIRAEREAMTAQSNGRPKRATRKKAAPMKKVTKSAKRKSTKKKARKS